MKIKPLFQHDRIFRYIAMCPFPSHTRKTIDNKSRGDLSLLGSFCSQLSRPTLIIFTYATKELKQKEQNVALRQKQIWTWSRTACVSNEVWSFSAKLAILNRYLNCCRSEDGFEFTPNGPDTRYHSAAAKDTEIGPLSFAMFKEYSATSIGEPQV